MSTDIPLPRWGIQSVGRRPSDFIARDLLFGSSIRDPRAFKFQHLLRDSPKYVRKAVKHLSPAQQVHAARVIILNGLQQQLYAQILISCRDKKTCSLLKKMQKCPPAGAEVSLRRTVDRWSCKNRFCPWCHARQV